MRAKAVLIFHFSFVISLVSFSQDTVKHFVPAPVVIVPDTSVHITEAPGVNRTMQKRLEFARLSQGKFPGYRIQVGFGQDRNEAMRLRSDVSLKYPNLPTYLAYQQPYFKICVGDFRTKLEAVKYLNTIKKAYPGAFMVKDKIYPPPINN
jgi:hypothetical protein